MSSGNNFFEDMLNVVTQVGTGGLVGFDSDEGGITSGLVGAPIVDVVKDVTGANAAEEANKQSRERFEEEKSAADQSRTDAKATSAANQTRASNLAGAARTTSRTRNATSQRSNFSPLGSDERDFLGL